MVPYKNGAGNSGVVAYQTGEDRITVQFIGGDTYIYTNASAGVKNIKQMKTLAEAGKGLSTFISTTVKDRYERKV
jgi:D-aminopeptidase